MECSAVGSQEEVSRHDPDSEREVFRSAGSLILSWAWLVVAVIVLVDLAVQGRDHAAVVTAVLVLAVSGIIYACAWRPRIVADTGGISVLNPLRDHTVPWGAVVKVDVVNAVRVHCAPPPSSSRGRVIYSWAMQASMRSARRASLRATRSRSEATTAQRNRLAGTPPGQQPRRYGEPPPEIQDALDRTSADYTAGRLEERAQRARHAGAVGGQAVSRWAWVPLAAMLVPVAVLVIVALA
jgi:Bacterial PH domain